MTPPIHQYFAVCPGPICKSPAYSTHEASLPRFALGYNPLECSTAPAAGAVCSENVRFCSSCGRAIAILDRRPWNWIEMLSCPRRFPQVRARHEAGDSRRALFSSIAPCLSSLVWESVRQLGIHGLRTGPFGPTCAKAQSTIKSRDNLVIADLLMWFCGLQLGCMACFKANYHCFAWSGGVWAFARRSLLFLRSPKSKPNSGWS